MLQRYEIPFLCEKERKVIFSMHTKQRLKIHKLRCNNFTYLPPYLSFYPTNFGWLMSLEAQYYKVRYCLLHILYLLYIFGHQSAIMGAEICKTLMTVFCPLIFPWKREREHIVHTMSTLISQICEARTLAHSHRCTSPLLLLYLGSYSLSFLKVF